MNRQTQQERIYEILSDGRWHSTGEIMEKTGIGYPPRRIHELRKRGYDIETRSTDMWNEYRMTDMWDRFIAENTKIANEMAREVERAQKEEKPQLSQEELYQLTLIK